MDILDLFGPFYNFFGPDWTFLELSKPFWTFLVLFLDLFWTFFGSEIVEMRFFVVILRHCVVMWFFFITHCKLRHHRQNPFFFTRLESLLQQNRTFLDFNGSDRKSSTPLTNEIIKVRCKSYRVSQTFHRTHSGWPNRFGMKLGKIILNQFCYWAQVSIIKCSQKVELIIASIFYTWSSKRVKV